MRTTRSRAYFRVRLLDVFHEGEDCRDPARQTVHLAKNAFALVRITTVEDCNSAALCAAVTYEKLPMI